MAAGDQGGSQRGRAVTGPKARHQRRVFVASEATGSAAWLSGFIWDIPVYIAEVGAKRLKILDPAKGHCR